MVYNTWPSIQDSNDQNTLSKTIALSLRFSLCVYSTNVLEFDSFIVDNNLGNFLKDSLCELKRCSMTFCFATHALSYETLYL